MMKENALIKTLFAQSIKDLDFVDKYANVVRTHEFYTDDGTNKGKKKRYPVACDVLNGDCANNGKNGVYDDLVPDDSKKSVVYWEVVRPLRDTGKRLTGRFGEKLLKGTVRLVVWLNSRRLGVEECDGVVDALLQLENLLTFKTSSIKTGVFEGAAFWSSVSGTVEQDKKNIFGKYTYPDDLNYYLYPFNFFAIDVEFKLHQCLNKPASFEDSARLDCENDI